MTPPVKRSPAEDLKENSRRLRGPVLEDLATDSPQFSRPSVGVLKFHGVYQQDDRDLRKKSPTKVYSCMVRVGVPGGGLTAEQYIGLDRLADEAGDGTLRITSRQGVQYHYVGKTSLARLIRSINETGLNTWAACGDVVRNVTACSAPLAGAQRGDMDVLVRELRRALQPASRAYAEIWLDGEKAATLESPAELEEEPLYGATYLPRKFKIGFAFEGDNTTDIYSNDLGFVPHFEGGVLAGFTVLAGGGMGQANGVKGSYPRMADPVCFVGPDEVLEVSRAVVSIHRDFGNRVNRKLARLKYVMDERGLDWFKEELAARLGRALQPPRELVWTRADDYLGWHEQAGGGWFFGLRVVSGRLAGAVRAAVREVVERFGCAVRFTVQQNLYFAGLREEQKAEVEGVLRKHGVALPGELPPVLRHSMACPALPTCGMAITESERILPDVAAEVQKELSGLGLDERVVHLRTTGCPNGCARPYTAEIGIVGESVELYTIYLGGSPRGDRLGSPYRRLIPLKELAATLRPLFEQWRDGGAASGESFGDWYWRVKPS